MRNQVHLFFSVILFALFCPVAKAQRMTYCALVEGRPITPGKYHADSVYATYAEEATGLALNLANTSKDTIYLFRSYFDKSFIGSKYLHRVNKKKQLYIVSFLPLVPHLSTRYSDAITSDPVVGNGQIVYDYFMLPPNTAQQIYLSYKDLFKNKNKKSNVSADFDVKSLHKYSKIPNRFYTVDKIERYKFQIQLAIYKNVKLLCTENAFFLQESDFDIESKKFEILTVPVNIRMH